jgi:hypothetical protein
VMTAPSHGTPVRWFVELLDVVGSQPVGATVRQCPSPGHGGDAHPSLSVSQRDSGGVRLHCFAGCPEREVLRALGLGVRQLYQPPAVSPRRFAEAARLRLQFAPVVLRRGHPASRGFRLERCTGTARLTGMAVGCGSTCCCGGGCLAAG